MQHIDSKCRIVQDVNHMQRNISKTKILLRATHMLSNKTGRTDFCKVQGILGEPQAI